MMMPADVLTAHAFTSAVGKTYMLSNTFAGSRNHTSRAGGPVGGVAAAAGAGGGCSAGVHSWVTRLGHSVAPAAFAAATWPATVSGTAWVCPVNLAPVTTARRAAPTSAMPI